MLMIFMTEGTSLPLPAVSQVELLRLFGPERPELDLEYVWQCLFTFGSERLELKRRCLDFEAGKMKPLLQTTNRT